MTRPSLLIRIYRLLLRLYPRHFRETFAEEMIEVFAAALNENQAKGTFSLIGLISWELWCFPASLIREHIEASHNRSIEGENSMSSQLTLYRAALIILFVGILLYLGLVIAPFFIYGIDQQPYFQIVGGNFDPKGYPLFDYRTTLGNLINIITLSTMVFAPIGAVVFGIVTAVQLVRRWRWILPSQRAIGLLVMLATVSLMLFSFSPLGRLIITWHMD